MKPIGEIGYATLHDRHVAAAGAIADAMLPKTMAAVGTADKEPGMFDALCWRLDGNVLDDEFNFATRVALRVSPVAQDDKPQTVPVPANALINRRYRPTKG